MAVRRSVGARTLRWEVRYPPLGTGRRGGASLPPSGFAWWFCMVVLHGGFAWWFCMVVLHGGFAWWFCMVVLHGGFSVSETSVLVLFLSLRDLGAGPGFNDE